MGHPPPWLSPSENEIRAPQLNAVRASAGAGAPFRQADQGIEIEVGSPLLDVESLCFVYGRGRAFPEGFVTPATVGSPYQRRITMANLNQQAAQRAAEQAQRAQQAAVKHAHQAMAQAQETARRNQQLRMAMQAAEHATEPRGW